MPRGPEKEIEQLKRRRQKAQDSGDIAEEAKICNNIGALYFETGDVRRALHYHQVELSLSEAGRDRLGAAIAHRMVGECECELGNYDTAVQHQTKHLKIAQGLGDLLEEQRALATIGRTHFSQSESQRGLEADESLVLAGSAYLKSLDVCDRLVGKTPDWELLQMKGRLYLNLGLVYQNQRDYRSARKFLEKALDIVKDEANDSSTVFRCYLSLGTLHLQENHPALALRCYQQAVGAARKEGSGLNESEALQKLAVAYLQTSSFDAAKSCLKKVLQMAEGSQGESEGAERQLRTIRKILQYSVQVESVGVEDVGERLRLYDKLGDLCCSLAAYTAAVKFYGEQLRLAEAHGLEPRELSRILVSLARSHNDCRQFSQALLYYQRELELWRGNPREECKTWTAIALTREDAGESSGRVLEAFLKAAQLSREAGCPQQEAHVHKSALKYLSSQQGSGAALESERAQWEGQLCRLQAQHPEAIDELSSDSDSSQQLSQDSDPPSSLPSSASEKEEEEELETVPRPHSKRGVATYRKRRVNRTNWKGETPLHTAAIEDNLAMAQRLIREGAEVNARDNCGWLPLHEACNLGHLEVARCLLDNGAAVNDGGGAHCGGMTPLMDAATNGHLDVVELVVERGAELRARDTQGRTALAVVEERLSSNIQSESGQSFGYELAEDHRAIRDFLLAESRRRGYRLEDVERGSTPGATEGRRTRRRRGHDRTGRGVLYSSDEEDIAPQRSVTGKKSGALERETSNPFKNFTVGSGSCHDVGTSETQRGGSAVKFPASQPPRGLPNPLGQVEEPALIPEDEWAGREGWREGLDDWLVDDMGQPPAKRKRRGGAESSLGSSGASAQRPKGRQSLSWKGKERLSAGGGSGGKSVPREGSSSSVRSSGSSRRADQSTVLLDSDSDDDVGGAQWEEGFGAAVLDSSGTLGSSAPVTLLNPPLEPPLRIRVRIERHTYLVPCPRQEESGLATSIGWLADQAAQRYYQQHGVRPRLSLNTRDGALLCTSDPIAHALQSNEEVVGVAEQWLLPPLAERYQTSCKNAGVACHLKTLRLFQFNGTPSSLDLSHFGLRPLHAGPTLQALQGCHALSFLSLAGNRFGGGAVLSSLAQLNTLGTLDLTCTGISAQCLASLSSCPPSNSASSPSPWSSLRQLSLSHNPLGPTCGPALGRLLSSCQGLRELALACCGLTAAVFDQHAGVGRALKALPGLAELCLSHNPLEWEGLGALLQATPRLTRLELADTCPQGSIGRALRLAEVEGFFRESGGRLEILDLSHCGLEDSDLPPLVALLGSCSRLQELRLAGGAVSREGVAQLCKLSLSELQGLDLSGNPQLGADGCLQLLQLRKRLSRLNLAGCGLRSPLPEAVLQGIGEWLAGGKAVLELAGNQISRTDKLLIATHQD